MNSENLKELLRLGEQYLRSHGGGRRTDDAMSAWGWRLAKRTSWPHLDAKTYWLTFGHREIRWCLMTVDKKMRVRTEADFTSSMSEDAFGDPKNDFEPAETERELPDDEDVNDFVGWKKRYDEAVQHCTPSQRDVIERHLKGERLRDQDYVTKMRGIRNIRKALAK